MPEYEWTYKDLVDIEGKPRPKGLKSGIMSTWAGYKLARIRRQLGKGKISGTTAESRLLRTKPKYYEREHAKALSKLPGFHSVQKMKEEIEKVKKKCGPQAWQEVEGIRTNSRETISQVGFTAEIRDRIKNAFMKHGFSRRQARMGYLAIVNAQMLDIVEFYRGIRILHRVAKYMKSARD
ncbi:MAG: hypothetical protein ABH863_03975 [Candidatus Micrarchaeota archaeon]